MPHLADLTLVLFIMAMLFAANRLSRLADALGRFVRVRLGLAGRTARFKSKD